MSLGGKLLRNTVSAVGGRFAATLLGVATFAILARTVGTHGLGQYRTVLTLLLFAGTLVDLGLYTVTLHALSRPGADQRRILGNVVGLRLCTSAAAILLLALGTALFEEDEVIRLGVFVAGFGWVGFQISEVLRAVFQQQLVQHQGAITETTGALLTLVLVLAFAALGWSTDSMLAATAAGMVWSSVLAWWLVRRRIPFRAGFDLREWRLLVTAGLPIAGSAILMTVHFRADVLMLSLLRDPVDVGIYDAPTKLYELVFMLPHLFGGLLMPLFVRDLAGPQATLRPRLHAACTAVLLFAVLCGAALFVEAENIVVLLGGEQFVVSAQPLHVLAFAAVLAAVSAMVRYAVTALNRQHRMLRADMISVIVAIAVHATLIPRYGAIGAAFGRLSGDAVRMLLTVSLLRGQLSRSMWDSVGIGALAAGLMSALLLAANHAGMNWMIACLLGGATTIAVVLCVPRVRSELRALAAG